MKKLLAALFVMTLVTAFVPKPLQYVYIDTDPKNTLYHSDKHCKAIKEDKKAEKGKYKVIKVTLEDAINKYKRKPCPLCCKDDDKDKGN